MCLANIDMSAADLPVIVRLRQATRAETYSKPEANRIDKGEAGRTVRSGSSDGAARCPAGVWDSAPGRWRVTHTANELSCITRGRVVIEDRLGRRWTFGAGDAFVVPAGFSGVWRVVESTSRLYAILESAST
jgi:uncharacterized cupin superfamily protein